MLEDLNWEQLEVRRIHTKLSLQYTIEHNMVDIPANRHLSRNDNQRTDVFFFHERINNSTYPSFFFPRTASGITKIYMYNFDTIKPHFCPFCFLFH